MTDQKTVPVPVDMLKALTPNNSLDGGSFGSTFIAVQALKALIPAPPKVGDVIESAEAAKALPVGTVLRDNVGDVWIVAGDSGLHYVNPRKSAPLLSRIDDPAFDYYKPVIISLPADA